MQRVRPGDAVSLLVSLPLCLIVPADISVPDCTLCLGTSLLTSLSMWTPVYGVQLFCFSTCFNAQMLRVDFMPTGLNQGKNPIGHTGNMV